MAFGQPNYYQNPYVNYGQYQVPQYTTPTPTLPIQSYSTINGKIVESEDIVKVVEIPIGGYGVFPLSDLSKVIIKSYDKDGNIQNMSYELVKQSEEKKNNVYETKLNDIYDYLEKLDKKMDEIKPSSIPKKKLVEVEVDADE